MSSDDLLIVAGEASGDLHAARLLAALGRSVPGVRAFGLGGDELREAGAETLADSSEIAVVGLFEILKILGRAREIFHRLLEEVDRRGTRNAILVDFPEFNLRLAKELKRRGVKVIYYISPQVWAWRRYRVRTIARRVDLMMVLFPFELDFYRGHGVAVAHVGHPLVDEVAPREQAWQRELAEGEPYRIALLPGSRRSEVGALLPTMLASVRRLGREVPIEVRLIRAPGLSDRFLEQHLGDHAAGIRVVHRDRLDAVADCHLAICASGTATLEVGLLGTPMVVVYKLSPWTYRIGRMLVRLPSISLVNLVLGRPVVPELIQGQAEPESIAAECRRLLTDGKARDEMRRGLAGVRGALGASGASERAAEQVLKALGRAAA